MAYNFPDHPFVGETFNPPNGPSWSWDGEAWKVIAASPPTTTSEVSVGDNLPTVGSWNGQLWWESDTGKLFVWYDDTTSSQWVQIVAPTLILDASNSLVKATGGTVTRKLSDWFAGMGREDNPPYKGFWFDQAPVNIWRMRDRVFIGDASNYDGSWNQSTGTWLGEPEVELFDGNANQHWLERSAQLYSNHADGGIAILGASRNSDKPVMTGQTTIGVAGYGYADNDGFAWGGYFEGVRSINSVSTTFGLEAGAKNLGGAVFTNPYDMFRAGATYGLWASGGGNSTQAPLPGAASSVAIGIGRNQARWLKGIVFDAGGLQGTDGTGTGKAIAIELARGQAISWRHGPEDFYTSGEIRSENHLAASETRIVFTDTGLQFRCMDGVQVNEIIIAHFPINPGAGIYPELSSGMAGIWLNAVGSNADGNINLNPKGIGNVITARSVFANNTAPIVAGGVANTGYMVSSTAGFGMLYGSGAPLVTAHKGSIYLCSDGEVNERFWVNTNGGGLWTPLIDDITGKVDIDHVGSGGDAHALVIPGPDPAEGVEWAHGNGLAGFMSGPDKAKLDTITAGVGATINRFINTPGTTTWFKPAGLVALEVWIQAAGGGGGGAAAIASQTAVGGGGGGGGAVRKFYDKAALDLLDPTNLGVTVIVGTGGIAGVISGGSGGTGSGSSFGTLTASGGAGGSTSGSTATAAVVPGAQPGLGAGGDENIQGGPGYHGSKAAGTTPYAAVGGVGGASGFGSGGGWARATNDTPGTDGTRGGGGAGGMSMNAGVGSAGGKGGDGYIKIREYY